MVAGYAALRITVSHFAYILRPLAFCLLPSACCLLPVAYLPIAASESKQTFYFHKRLWTIDYGPWTIYYGLFLPLPQSLSQQNMLIGGAVNHGTRHHATNSAVNYKIHQMAHTFLYNFRICILLHEFAGERCTE